MAKAGLEAAPCEKVKPPRVKASPIALECTHMQTVHLPDARDGSRQNVVIGRVVGIHIDDSVITDGMVDIRKVEPLARLGYLDYARILPENVFSLSPPGGDHRYEKK
jgi:flavin reductase (DIM6/NTAB) family NADH-FMN oxidoreductase RutF